MDTDHNDNRHRKAAIGLINLWISRYDKLLLRLAILTVGAAIVAQFITQFPDIRIAADRATSGFSFTTTPPLGPSDSVGVTLFLAPGQRTPRVAAFIQSRRVGNFSQGPSLHIDAKAGERIQIVNDTPYPCIVTATVSSDLQKDEVLATRLIPAHQQAFFPPVRHQQVRT